MGAASDKVFPQDNPATHVVTIMPGGARKVGTLQEVTEWMKLMGSSTSSGAVIKPLGSK